MAGVRAEVARPGSGHVCGASVRVACVRRLGGSTEVSLTISALPGMQLGVHEHACGENKGCTCMSASATCAMRAVVRLRLPFFSFIIFFFLLKLPVSWIIHFSPLDLFLLFIFLSLPLPLLPQKGYPCTNLSTLQGESLEPSFRELIRLRDSSLSLIALV